MSNDSVTVETINALGSQSGYEKPPTFVVGQAVKYERESLDTIFATVMGYKMYPTLVLLRDDESDEDDFFAGSSDLISLSSHRQRFTGTNKNELKDMKEVYSEAVSTESMDISAAFAMAEEYLRMTADMRKQPACIKCSSTLLLFLHSASTWCNLTNSLVPHDDVNSIVCRSCNCSFLEPKWIPLDAEALSQYFK